MTRARPASTQTGRPEATATYVYCVARSARPPDLRRAPPGLPGTGKLRALPADGSLWLIVADAPLARYGERPLARVVRARGASATINQSDPSAGSARGFPVPGSPGGARRRSGGRTLRATQ